MKKRSLVKQLLFAGSILTVAFACQSKTPKNTCPDQVDENTIQNDNDDQDDDGYGQGDTSNLNSSETAPSVLKVESATDSMDIKSAEPSVVSTEETAPEAPVVSDTEGKEEALPEVVVLEAVSPIEIIAEHQMQSVDNHADSSIGQN